MSFVQIGIIVLNGSHEFIIVSFILVRDFGPKSFSQVGIIVPNNIIKFIMNTFFSVKVSALSAIYSSRHYYAR